MLCREEGQCQRKGWCFEGRRGSVGGGVVSEEGGGVGGGVVSEEVWCRRREVVSEEGVCVVKGDVVVVEGERCCEWRRGTVVEVV